MAYEKRKGTATDRQPHALTVQLTTAAYHAINEIQRRHRVERGRALPAWKVLDATVKTYAREEGIQSKE